MSWIIYIIYLNLAKNLVVEKFKQGNSKNQIKTMHKSLNCFKSMHEIIQNNSKTIQNAKQ